MNPHRQALLRELERFGADNDARAADRQAKMLNITPETGGFLALLVRALRARRVLELGTSNGYSTLWLADAVDPLGGRVVTVEALPAKVALARENFARAGLADVIDCRVGDAGDFLGEQAPGSVEFLFLDASRSRYVHWWPALRKVLAPGGLLVVDNAVSHAQEMGAFLETVRGTPGFLTSLVPVGKGEFLALKERPGP